MDEKRMINTGGEKITANRLQYLLSLRNMNRTNKTWTKQADGNRGCSETLRGLDLESRRQ